MSSEYLRQHPLLLILSVAPAVLASIILALSFWPPVYNRIKSWRLPLMIVAYLVTRPLLMYIIFGILGNRNIANDNAWWTWMGRGVLAGKIPYRDFLCSHSPLFPYLMGIAYAIWNHPGAAVIIFIAFDIATLFLLCRFTKLVIGPEKVMDVAWIYVLNPVIWIVTVRYAQDETVISTFLLLTAYLYTKGSKWWNPLVMALGIMFTKFTTSIFMFTIYAYSKCKIRDAVVVCLVVILICIPFYLQHANLLDPLRLQNNTTAGVSITSIINIVLTDHHYTLAIIKIGSLLTLLALALTVYTVHRRRLQVLDGLTACLIVFLLFSPIAFKFYRLWYMGALSIHAVKTGKINRYAFYTGVLCLFDDFCFDAVTPHSIMYPMAVLAAIIIYIEAGYALEILRQKCTAKEDLQIEDSLAEVAKA